MSLLRILLKNTLKSTNALKFNRTLVANLKYSTTTKFQNVVEADQPDQPIKYTNSPASQWQAKSSRIGTDSERLWYEPYVIIGSIAAFMIYFCLLREENDIDKEFDKTLYSRIKGLEEKQLILILKYNQEHGLGTKEIEEKLREIAENKK